MNAGTEVMLRQIREACQAVDLGDALDLILGIPLGEPLEPGSCLASTDSLHQLVGERYRPGTFVISDRKDLPAFLSEGERIPFDAWVGGIVSEHLQQARSAANAGPDAPNALAEADADTLTRHVLDVLEERHPRTDSRLCEMVWNQEYDDVFRRIELALVTGNPECELDLHRGMGEAGGKVAFQVLGKVDESHIGLKQFLALSALAGLIGLNHKTSAMAASPIAPDRIIAIPLEPDEEDGERVRQQLLERSAEGFSIDDRDLFLSRLHEDRDSLRIAFILDDFIESLFDLKLAALLLDGYPHVSIVAVPRRGVCGNDMSYHRLVEVLEHPLYHSLREYQEEPNARFASVADGPRLGGLNLEKSSEQLAEALLSSDMLYVKGARNFEMMQGVKKATFYSFAVCRKVSEDLTGVPARSGQPLFAFRPSGEGNV